MFLSFKLMTYTPTWQRLVKALRHKRVGQTDIASEIEKDKLVTATHE